MSSWAVVLGIEDDMNPETIAFLLSLIDSYLESSSGREPENKEAAARAYTALTLMHQAPGSNWERLFDAMWENSKGGIMNPNYFKDFVTELLRRNRVQTIRNIEFMKRPELDTPRVQLLSRHQREAYAENTLGYNAALEDVLESLRDL
jgi:hypothetical protein